MKHQTHILLVSAQPTPNITPLLDLELRPEKAEVILVVSPDMNERADCLEEVLKPRGLRVHQWAVENAFDLEALQEFFLNRLSELEDRDLALNVTGGTKPMAIAAYQAFIAADKPIYYVHPELDRLIWLHPSGRATRDLENRIRLEAFFQAHGAESLSKSEAFGIREEFAELMQAIVLRVEKYQEALKLLNGLARSADNPELCSDPLSNQASAREDFASLLHYFEEQNLVKYARQRLVFPSEEARFFANGGWFEQYVYAVVHGLRNQVPSIQDIGRGVQLKRRRGAAGAANELDIAFLADNRLYVIECKTAQFNESERGDNALYKLKTLSAQFGGLQAKGMLVSFQELPNAVKQRAATDRIEICAGTQIKTLEDRLIQWIRL